MSILDEYYFGHLQPARLKDRELYLDVSRDIQHSFTGRMDMLGLHTFFVEASLMIRNAVKQYEEGFIDASFYSVRTAVEIARVVTYFGEKEDPQASEVYEEWRVGGKFPFDSVIRNELERSSAVYQEVREALSTFFEEQAVRLKSSQKYIHKQGYKTFYEQGFKSEKQKAMRRELAEHNFTNFISNSLTEIALLRLCIDPFPILLRDPEVMYKIHYESMTEAFSDITVEKIIGADKVALYCSTEFYRSHVAGFEGNQELHEDTHALINGQFYDRKKWKVIKSQLHLVPENDLLAVMIFNKSKEISKVYTYGGLRFYFSDTDTVRKNRGFSSKDFKEGQENSSYDEAFLSYVKITGEEFWLEHNEPLSKSLIKKIKAIDPTASS